MPRSASRQASNSKPGTPTETQSQWIMITEEKIFENGGSEDNNALSFCKLRHPKSEQGSLFLVGGGAGGAGSRTVREVVRFSPKCGSWLVAHTVQQDGSMLVTTPVDPVFLTLPYLIEAAKKGKFMTLDQIVCDDDFPDCRQLLTCQGLSCLDQVADFRGADDIQAYRYNKDKTLAWLSMKADQVANALRRTDIRVGDSGAHSVHFVRSKTDQTESDEACLKFAHGLLSDYLSLELAASLKEHLGIKDTKENVKPEQKDEEPPKKKAKLSKDDITPTDDYSSATPELKRDSSKGKQTAAQKRLSKVDKTGMKSISSFFSPKA